MEDFQCKVKKWYGSHYRLKSDQVMSYFDNKGLRLQHYCAPINLNKNQWVTIYVTLPIYKFTNGRIMINNLVYIDGAATDKNRKSFLRIILRCDGQIILVSTTRTNVVFICTPYILVPMTYMYLHLL